VPAAANIRLFDIPGFHPGDLRLHDLRTDRRVSGRSLPGENPLYVASFPITLATASLALWSCAATGNISAGLYYPMIVAGIMLVIGSLLLKETHGTNVSDEVRGAKS
jgi:hypothetical protein